MKLSKKNILLIAGGTGFIGRSIIEDLGEFYEIRILTRDREKTGKSFYHWNPEKGEIDEKALHNVTHIINLCGAPIVGKRWTQKRKEELSKSRVLPAQFLHSKFKKSTDLKQYISASGINCYDLNFPSKEYVEEDAYGEDFVSQLVKDWEQAADVFKEICKVVKLRISFVLSEKGGSLSLFEKPIKMGFAAILGKGNQAIPWIFIDDLVQIVKFSIEKNIGGTFNTNAGNTTNAELTKLLVKKNKRKIWLPKVPGIMLYIILGSSSVLILKGIRASSKKIEKEGFVFQCKQLEKGL